MFVHSSVSRRHPRVPESCLQFLREPLGSAALKDSVSILTEHVCEEDTQSSAYDEHHGDPQCLGIRNRHNTERILEDFKRNDRAKFTPLSTSSCVFCLPHLFWLIIK